MHIGLPVDRRSLKGECPRRMGQASFSVVPLTVWYLTPYNSGALRELGGIKWQCTELSLSPQHLNNKTMPQVGYCAANVESTDPRPCTWLRKPGDRRRRSQVSSGGGGSFAKEAPSRNLYLHRLASGTYPACVRLSARPVNEGLHRCKGEWLNRTSSVATGMSPSYRHHLQSTC